jgi:glycyl-tRNA synthetase beta chain
VTDATLLVELQTEELPPRSLAKLADAFGWNLHTNLKADHFLADEATTSIYATPRRIAVSISHVREVAPDFEVTAKGPAVKSGLDGAGNPTKALLGFASKRGVTVDKLVRVNDGKQEVFAHRDIAKGGQLDTNLELLVEEALKRLPISKMMRWGAGEAAFVRPVHGLVMLHGTRRVPGTVLGVRSGKITRGHRFMGNGEIALASADAYETTLLDEGMVIADFPKRRSEIDRQLIAQAHHHGAGLGDYEPLLDEVTALVEHPSVYVGEFDKAFLAVPQECLILTMRQNQKYFPLFDAAGKLTGKFLIVSNMQVADPRHIVGGNQRVVRPRLEDARFFYDQDRKNGFRCSPRSSITTSSAASSSACSASSCSLARSRAC